MRGKASAIKSKFLETSGLLLLRFRKDRALSQQDVGKVIGVRQNKVCDIEKAARALSLYEAVQLSQYYAVPINTFCGLSPTDDLYG